MICILSAMSEEVRDLIPLLSNIKVEKGMDRSIIIGELKGQQILLYITGIGVLNASIAVQYLVNRFPIKKIINIGTAGAISDLKIGAVVKVTQVSTALEGYHSIEILSNDNDKCIHLLTSPTTVKSSMDKNKLKHEDYDLVDMEAYAIAYCAHQFDIKCDFIKIVSDYADEKFESDFAESITGTSSNCLKYVMKELVSLLN